MYRFEFGKLTMSRFLAMFQVSNASAQRITFDQNNRLLPAGKSQEQEKRAQPAN